jgi:hypothetical protein
VSVRPIVWGQRRLDLGFDQTDFLVDACKRRDVVVDLLDTRCQLVSVDLDPADVLTECSGLHDQDPSDPLADRQEIVAVRTDDQVDVMLELPGDPPVIPAFLGHREAEVREQDHERSALIAQLSGDVTGHVELVEGLESPVHARKQVAERRRQAEDPDPAEQHRWDRAGDRREVREQLRMGRDTRVLLEDPRTVAEPACVPDRGDVAQRHSEQAVHSAAFRDVREALRGLLDVACIEVQHGMSRPGFLLAYDRRDLRDPLRMSVNVVRMEDGQPHQR